jgi:hypothetical protein
MDQSKISACSWCRALMSGSPSWRKDGAGSVGLMDRPIDLVSEHKSHHS